MPSISAVATGSMAAGWTVMSTVQMGSPMALALALPVFASALVVPTIPQIDGLPGIDLAALDRKAHGKVC